MVEVRAPERGACWELVTLRRLAELLRARRSSFSPTTSGLIALGHGGPGGVHDGAPEPARTYVLTMADATQHPGAWAYAVACDTAPELVSALVRGGMRTAAGYTEALRLPASLTDDPAELDALADYVATIADAVASDLPPVALDQRLYVAQKAAFLACSEATPFLLLGFIEQLRDALYVAHRAAA